MLDPAILFSSVLNGLTTGAVYALIALGLTLIYGVLHIINFAHGAALMVALYAVYLLKDRLGIDPYAALPLVVAGMFGLGYALQRFVINRASHAQHRHGLHLVHRRDRPRHDRAAQGHCVLRRAGGGGGVVLDHSQHRSGPGDSRGGA